MTEALTYSQADVVRYLLIGQSLGTLPSASGAWPISVGMELDTPDNTITVYNTQGKLQGRIQTTGEAVEQYGVQIRIRSTTDQVGFVKANSIRTTITETVYQNTVAIGASNYLVHSLLLASSVLPLGRDTSSNRFLHTINVLVNLRQL